MQFAELLVNRRSIRKFQEKDVPLELVQQLIAVSTLAPNSGNEQPWKFIVVKNKETMKRMSDDSKKNIF